MDKEQKIFYTSLFLSGSPLDKKFFRKIFDPINLENRLLSYVEQFNSLELGMRIRMVSGGYQMVTDKELLNELEPFFGEKTEALSRASMETAAIVAYKQPITRIEIDEIRGVNSSGTVRYLLEKNLIKVTGRKDVPGRPLLYSTTKFFLEYMGINDISELPTFREWQELKTRQ